MVKPTQAVRDRLSMAMSEAGRVGQVRMLGVAALGKVNGRVIRLLAPPAMSEAMDGLVVAEERELAAYQDAVDEGLVDPEEDDE